MVVFDPWHFGWIYRWKTPCDSRRISLELTLGKLSDAESATRHALALNPSGENYHVAMGVIQLKRGLRIEAIREFERELQLHPANAMARHWMAQAMGTGATTEQQR